MKRGLKVMSPLTLESTYSNNLDEKRIESNDNFTAGFPAKIGNSMKRGLKDHRHKLLRNRVEINSMKRGLKGYRCLQQYIRIRFCSMKRGLKDGVDEYAGFNRYVTR